MSDIRTTRISLVIPCFNEASAIEGCLQAVFAQTHPFDEVIVVDNNCTDRTIKLAKKFPVEIVKETTQGVAFARDAGFDAASGDVIGRIDADTLLVPNWSEELLRVFSDPKVMAVTGPVYFHDMPVQVASRRADTFLRAQFSKFSKRAKHLFGSNMAVRKSAWSNVRSQVCHDKMYHEDLDLAVHLIEQNKRIIFDKKLVAGISSRRLASTLPEFKRYMKMLSNTYKKHDIYEASVTIPMLAYWSIYPGLRLLRSAYNPKTNRISVEKLLLGNRKRRPNPMGD